MSDSTGEDRRDPSGRIGNRRDNQPMRDRKLRDRALILPVVGLILLIPPVASIFQIDGRIGGVPVTLAYIFAVWAALIACAFWLSRRLGPGDDDPVAPAEGASNSPPDPPSATTP